MVRRAVRNVGGWLLLTWVLAGYAVAAPDPTAESERLQLRGELRQGALLTGRVPPGSRVRLDGDRVRLGPEGNFVIGFDRDAGPTAELLVSLADGGELRRELSIEQREYDIQRIEGVPQHTVTPPPEALQRIREESALVRSARATDSDRRDFLHGFQWPLTGPVTGVFGSQRVYNGEPRRPHFGVDIAAPTGTAVRAPAPGRVVLVHPEMYFSGGTLILDHGFGVSSTFIHLHRVLVEEGEEVGAGDVIAEVGASGRATGPHLDWRINWFGARLDPQTVVGAMPSPDGPSSDMASPEQDNE